MFDPDAYILTACQMQAVETWAFDQGLPVAALMERAGIACALKIQGLFPQARRIGVLTGPGHNGADSLVVARELLHQGYTVHVFLCADPHKLKPLTQDHLRYYRALGGALVNTYSELACCDLLIDGIFGLGLTRPVGQQQALIHWVNGQTMPVVSLDLPTGIHSDTGEVLGCAIRATHTLCLGFWKQGVFQDAALAYTGTSQRLDLHLPAPDLVGLAQTWGARITLGLAQPCLPLNRPPAAHKYAAGKLLIIAGSRRFAGAALLTALGAKASGVGLIALAVPESLVALLLPQIPDAVFYPCPETAQGTLAQITVDPLNFSAIACGPGLTPCPDLIRQVLSYPRPLVLDADGINSLDTPQALLSRSQPTVITPHPGEFRRLFPDLDGPDRVHNARQAAQLSGATVVLKGACTVIANPQGAYWINTHSTPALARAGSGDVLTGLLGGLLAQGESSAAQAAIGAVWWHSQTALFLAQQRTVLGVDPLSLAQNLTCYLGSQVTLIPKSRA